MKQLIMMLTVAALTLSLAVPLSAQDVELRADHPSEYVVREGDTLWDIAARFLIRPWQWPAIWQANPQIDNPHLIFPGDVISLVYVEGEPRLMVDETRRLSPEIRRESIVGPVTTIPLEAIRTFLVKPRVAGADELSRFPYIVANEERQVFAATPDRTYARGLGDRRVGDQVIIARVNYQFEDASAGSDRRAMRQNRMRNNLGQVPYRERPIGQVRNSAERLARSVRVLGYQLWEVARAEVVKTGDPGILSIIESEREVMAGDYVLPLDPHLYDLTFHPRPMEREIPAGARVVAINDAQYGVGHYQIVALGLGEVDGVEPGHTFSAFRPGDVVRDRFHDGLRGRPVSVHGSGTKVELPEEFAGLLMVFRTFDRISYALVMGGDRAIREGDLLFHPDRRL